MYKMYKKILSFICILMIVLSTDCSIFASEISTTTEYLPYEEMDYDYDIVSKEDWENTDIGEYPLDVQAAEWKLLSSSEAEAACDMPKEYAESLTTKELVEYVVNYPFLMDILAFDSISDGINSLKSKSSAFDVLFSRQDCYDELLNKYSEMDVNYLEVDKSNDICQTNYDSELFIEAYIGLSYDLLTERQALKFVEEYGNNFIQMNGECQESGLSTLFYDAVEEKMGVIPESAIPESIATKLTDSIDASDTSVLAASSTCSSCGASFTNTSITVNGKTVNCFKWSSGGYGTTDIAKLDKYIADYHPSYTKVRSASSKYNCHSYAWYSTSSSNAYWIDDPSPIYSNTSYWTLWAVPMRNLQSGDKITFWNQNGLLHSASVNSSTACTSKLGHYGVYKTTITEMKTFYDSSSTTAYVPK